jgi:5'-deoxynucleotidase YfbR-like HD superfamily hydrolase
MYRMGIITMLCPPELGIDRNRCVKMALIHDMAEALVGDITPPDNIAKGVSAFVRRDSDLADECRREIPTRARFDALHLRPNIKADLRNNCERIHGSVGRV